MHVPTLVFPKLSKLMRIASRVDSYIFEIPSSLFLSVCLSFFGLFAVCSGNLSFFPSSFPFSFSLLFSFYLPALLLFIKCKHVIPLFAVFHKYSRDWKNQFSVSLFVNVVSKARAASALQNRSRLFPSFPELCLLYLHIRETYRIVCMAGINCFQIISKIQFEIILLRE